MMREEGMGGVTARCVNVDSLWRPGLFFGTQVRVVSAQIVCVLEMAVPPAEVSLRLRLVRS